MQRESIWLKAWCPSCDFTNWLYYNIWDETHPDIVAIKCYNCNRSWWREDGDQEDGNKAEDYADIGKESSC